MIWITNDSGDNRLTTPEEAEALLQTGQFRPGRSAPWLSDVSFTDARRASISASLKGRPLSEKHRADISATLKGRQQPYEMTEETRLLISSIRTGMRFTEEHRRAIAEIVRGRKWVTSLETGQERQLRPEEAADLVATGDWRWGRANRRWGRHAAS